MHDQSRFSDSGHFVTSIMWKVRLCLIRARISSEISARPGSAKSAKKCGSGSVPVPAKSQKKSGSYSDMDPDPFRFHNPAQKGPQCPRGRGGRFTFFGHKSIFSLLNFFPKSKNRQRFFVMIFFIEKNQGTIFCHDFFRTEKLWYDLIF